MRVLGIDPGTFKMGVGIVDSDAGELRWVFSDVIAPLKQAAIPQRLYFIFRTLSDLIEEWHPVEVAIEQPFSAANVHAAMAIGYAEAAAMIAAAAKKIPVFKYAPRQVKQAVTNYGGSSKEQVNEMVKLLLQLDRSPVSNDAADALAVAICHINAGQIDRLVEMD